MKYWKLVVAMSENGVIGQENNLPWDVPEEKKFFRTVTSGKNVVMGRKTFESLKKIDPQTKYIILTKNTQYVAGIDNCKIYNNIEDVKKEYSDKKLCICGGKEIYASFVDECEEIILSTIKGNFEGNVVMGNIINNFIKVKQIIATEKFTVDCYLNQRLYPQSRFTSGNELSKAYKKYVDGSEKGVVGHHVYYPVNLKNNGNIGELILKLKENSSDNVNIYIHWPYCYLPNETTKCDFCMCNTKNNPRDLSYKMCYFESLIKELNLYAHILGKRKIANLYIGGGTPMTMTEKMFEKLFKEISTLFEITEKTLISVESRPEMITKNKIKLFVEYGVKKISLGVENFNDDIAFKMGRIKQGQEYYKIVKQAMQILKKEGIEYVNIDLIYGHPAEKEIDIDESIEKVLSLNPDSISYYVMGLPYGCTKIENSKKYESKWKSIEYRCMQAKKISEIFKLNGYEQVVESIWVKNGKSGKSLIDFPNGLNNTCYLTDGVWIGVGIGSIGFIELFGQVVNINDIEEYIKKVQNDTLPIDLIEKLDVDEMIRSYIIINLLHGRIDKKEFEKKFSVTPESIFKEEFKLLRHNNDVWIDDKEIVINPKRINRMEGICRLFFSNSEEMLYRLRENKRIDYQFYGVTYNDIE